LRFKDFYRILPQSLAALSEIYDVQNKKLSFNHDIITMKLIINDKSFKKSVIKYLKNDLLLLHEILLKVSDYLLNTYKISLLDCFSTASMVMKIFITEFMKQERNSYFI